MITVNTCGGIGNQLFQYAYARTLHGNVQLLNNCTQYESSLYRFNIRLPFTVQPEGRWISERSLRYDYSPEVEDPCILAGYYQCENYFKHIENELRAEVTLREALSTTAQQFAALIEQQTNSVMLHVRRGDYLTWAAQRHGTLSMGYYLKAASYFANPHFFVFSDDATYNFTLPYPMTKVNCTPHEDLWLMSLCKNAIIANSSFSWWGAWLGADRTGTVIAPQQWLRTGNSDAQDIVPERWIKVGSDESTQLEIVSPGTIQAATRKPMRRLL